MKERPILFSGPLVLALLAGTKTQTRRICKGARELSNALDWPLSSCPYGVPGDRLWVRETFGLGYADGAGGYSAIPWSGSDPKRDAKVFYRATYNEPDPSECGRLPWTPSIYMPRWASRITLEITKVRVERLQDITEEDALAEGVRACLRCDGKGIDPVRIDGCDPEWCNECGGGSEGIKCRDEFARLWDIINGKRAPWESNPWVFVLDFRRVEQAEAAA